MSKVAEGTIECSYDCGCWFDFKHVNEVTQSCMYHNTKLLMRSDVKKVFEHTPTGFDDYSRDDYSSQKSKKYKKG